MRFNVAIGALFALGCASAGPDLARCPPVAEMRPPPSEQCRSDRDVIDYQRQLATVVEGDAGPLRVRVELDSQSVIDRVCADRTSASGHARARKQLAAKFAGVPLEKAPGPPCLANSRLDFNLQGAQLARMNLIARKCERQAMTSRRAFQTVQNRDAGFGDYFEARAYVDCMQQKQRELDQIWLFDRALSGNVAYVFYGTPESAVRDRALHECFPRYDETATALINDTSFLPDESDRESANACMRSQGWEIVPPE